MALIDNKIFKLERPDSFFNPEAECYEFLLAWYGDDGAFYSWLFTDNILKSSVSASVLNTDSKSITKFIESAENVRVLTAEDLDGDTYDSLASIIRAKFVYRVFTDGTHENIAVKTSSLPPKVCSDVRYNIEIEIIEQAPKLMN